VDSLQCNSPRPHNPPAGACAKGNGARQRLAIRAKLCPFPVRPAFGKLSSATVTPSGAPPMKKKLSIGSWAYLFNQEQPTNDFHVVLHKLQDLGYDGVELGSFGVHPTPWSHPTKASRQKLKKEVADHGLEFSGIAVDLWSFKKPGPSIMDENPTPY